MDKNWVKRNKWIFVAGPLALVAFIAIGGEVVMHLWNWLIPALTGWRPINLWQALGLMVLCRILFGNLGCGHGGSDRSNSRRPKPENWDRMTPEERDKFRQEMRSRWCGTAAPASGSNDPA
ncbi:MAG: hypothetical protein ABSD72_14330 [Terracidiphilus sp.]|jgi:hypothetical protein